MIRRWPLPVFPISIGFSTSISRYDHAHNARLDEELYNMRWMTETCFSVVKRSHGATVRAQTWYREFRECVLMFAIYNVERASKAL
jgi:IS5 family transposase